MSNSRVIVIGIDGLDRGLIDRYGQVMPNLQALIHRGANIAIRSVLPPDSNTAWATIYTGLSPAQHGLVHFVDPLNRIQLISSREVGAGVVEGRTFWDFASRAGKRVSLILPHLGYPVWPVNGFMAGRSTITDEVQCFPVGDEPAERLARLNTVKGFPGSKRAVPGYLRRVRGVIEAEAELGCERVQRRDWDLFFWYSSALDLVMHFFWRFADSSDPSYPGPNEYGSVLEDFHALYDAVLGRLLEHAPQDASIVVLSDHGHGMRPVRLLNINEILRRAGLFVKREGRGSRSLTAAGVERLKRLALELVSRYDLGPLASKALRCVPGARKAFTNPLTVDWSRTRAYATDLSGIKAYSYGGIMIRKDGMTATDYERVRTEAIDAVQRVRDPVTGEAMVKVICRREDLYRGEYLDRYPDIVFDLQDGYGAGWAANGELVSNGSGHSLVPGSHKADSAVLVIAPAQEYEIQSDEAELVDIAPTMLHLLGLPPGVGRPLSQERSLDGAAAG